MFGQAGVERAHSMQITLGIDRADTPERLVELAEAGANEFFAGFIPCEWTERFGWEVSLNRRENGPQYQFTDYGQLRETIEAVHQLGRRVALTLNAHQYCRERYDLLRQIVERIEVFEPDSYIVADPALMLEMRNWGIQRTLHLSTGGGCFNPDAIRYFYERFGVRRVVVPRKNTIREMGRLVEELSDIPVELEAMVMQSRCPFNDEFCFTLHSFSFSSFCNTTNEVPTVLRRFPPDWKDRLLGMSAEGNTQQRPGSKLDQFMKDVAYDKEIPFGKKAVMDDGEEGVHPKIAGMFFMNCGLCAIQPLKKAGIAVLKLPLRGEPQLKLDFLRLVRHVMEHDTITRDECRALIQSPAYCRQPDSCYYHIPEG